MTTKDVEQLAVVVKIRGKVYQVLTSNENNDWYFSAIEALEGGLKLLDEPIEGLTMESKK